MSPLGMAKRRRDSEFRTEPEQLAKLVLATAKPTDCDAFEKFISHRYLRPFQHSVVSSFRYGFAFTSLTVLVIAGGVSSSVLAGSTGGGTDWVIAVLGILVAVVAAVNRLWRPGSRAAIRHRTANALRREGWSFVCREGAYKKAADEDLASIFFREVERINLPAESIDEQELEGEGGP